MTAQFGYLLNAMERAACESKPAEHDYKGKRIAVLGYVSALEVERERLRAELETERMRLVACSVIALANTPESAASARDMHPDYQSPSCDDVARAIDREIALRAELAECQQDAERYRWVLEHWDTGGPDFGKIMFSSTAETLSADIDTARKGEGE